MIRSAKRRALLACVALAMCFTGFSYRLIDLQVCRHDEFAKLAAAKHCEKQITYGHRGQIQDVNQEILADNEPVATVVADGSLVTDAPLLSSLLAGPLELDDTELAQKLHTSSRYMVLKRKVPTPLAEALMQRLRVRTLPGIALEQDEARTYPNGQMLAHVIGFMNGQHEGVQGIEKTMNDFLTGHAGFRCIERDRTGKELVLYRGQERAPRDGCNVRLTVDLNLQNIVEAELDDACSKFKPEKATIILMRPGTGEILALANRPSFDPNEIQSADYLRTHADDMKNSAVIEMFEPGSTFKIVTASAALNEHLVEPGTMIFCENGHFNFGGKILHDHAGGFADLSVSDILMHSSNIGAAKLALRTGDQKFYEYIRRFGFGERTGISLPGEISGQANPPYKWQKIDITRIAMGHSIGVTPLQSICAMAAVANGGHLMMPQIVHEIVDADGATVASFPPVEIRRVVTDETARQVRAALKNVVSEYGTAVGAKVSGFEVAGKTGTAEKINPNGRGYLSGKYIVSFIGFLPADNPKFIGLVMLDDAKVSSQMNYGGQIAGPIFAHVAEKAARYLNLQPAPVEPGKMIITQRGH